MSRPCCAAVLALGLSSCTVGPGGSFPDTGGTAAMTVSTTVAATASDSDAQSSTSESGAEDSSGATQPWEPSGTDATAADDTTGAVGDASAASDSSSSSDGSDSAAGTPLDPLLDIPDGGQQCDYPGDLNECPGIAVCRFATVEYGLCESCEQCGNLNAACTQGDECDILFSCYAGHCTNFCTLGTFECGPVEACLDVGHPTRGVCDPFA